MINTLTFPILRLLADGRFHSGEAIAKQFNVTRTTVWAAVQEAQNLGITVFSVRGRGYKLPDPIVMLDREAILTAIGTERAWFKLELHDSLESTNSYLMKKANQQGLALAPHATCVVAELQTAGKGRRGRSWQAGLGASLTFSLLWRFQCGAAALSGLSLAIGVGLIRALHSLGVPSAAEMQALHDRVASLEAQLGKKPGTKAPAKTPAKTAANKAPAKKVVAPKAVKKSPAKPAAKTAAKPAAKKAPAKKTAKK